MVKHKINLVIWKHIVSVRFEIYIEILTFSKAIQKHVPVTMEGFAKKGDEEDTFTE